MRRSVTQVFVAIGSNLEPERQIASALQRLTQRFAPLRCSDCFRTPAVGFDGPPFLNLVVGFDSDLSPTALSQWLSALENDHGRDRSAPKYASRTLDLDLLLYGDQVSEQPALPHRDILRYPFVLQPLAELAPDRRHPQLQLSYLQLWQERACEFAELLASTERLPCPRAEGLTR